ncbi:maleylpyruvate isomerase family mycothiol-dependent enzyme [soil metagenome]
MPAPGPAVLLDQAPALIERAVGYTRTSLTLVTPALMCAPTPCAQWDLAVLLRHMDDSLAAFTEAADLGYVAPEPAVRASSGAVIESLKARACALLGAWSVQPNRSQASVAGHPMPSRLLAAAGALEITVHGWDVATACGARRSIPEPLAKSLLEVVGLVVGHQDRTVRFGPPVAVPVEADASTRLLAALGRRA